MKSLVCLQPGHFEYIESAAPILPPEHALLRIRRIGVCGTDLHAFEGTQPYFNYPRILGHELSGEIVAINGTNSKGFQQNELVSVLPYFSCGSCIACRNGKTNCCVNMQVAGVHRDGGMSEFLSVPLSMLIRSSGLDADSLALLEPFAIGAHAIERAHIKPGEFVLVIGAGPIGVGVMLFAKLAGAEVIAMDVNLERLERVQKIIGPLHLLHVKGSNTIDQLKHLTNSELPTLVIDATGSQQAINNALQYVAHGGRYVLVGLQKDNLIFSHPEFHRKEMTLMSSRNATRKDFDKVRNIMIDDYIDLSSYITHRVPFTEVKKQFPYFLKPESGVLKAIIEL